MPALMEKPLGLRRIFLGVLASVCLVLPASSAQSGEAGETLKFEIDTAKTFPISPFIYGINGGDWKGKCKGLTLGRCGGNRMTAYNWENNASNAGSDWQHQNDAFLGGGEIPGEVMRKPVAEALGAGVSILVTIPIIGHVAADKKGGGDVNQTPDYIHKRFVESVARKGAPFADKPDLNDGKVYQDEFVNWLEKQFPNARKDPKAQIFYCMDNEPDLWQGTHARIHPKKVEYDELAKLNAEYADAVKSVAPKALVFGPVNYGWMGFATLQDAPDRKNRDFLEFFLAEMKAAEAKAGKRLLDVLDIHWYPEAQGGGKRICEDDTNPGIVAGRLQAPRSLWDDTYVEESWIAKDVLGKKAIRLLPRIREKVEKNYPGTKVAITEYYYGGGAHISGGIAQADVLGVFGREGLFAACLWHLGKTDARFIYAGYALYRNYDGQGGQFGDTGLGVTGGDAAKAMLFASVDEKKRLVLVALNKTDKPLTAEIHLKGGAKFAKAKPFVLTDAKAELVAGAELSAKPDGSLDYPMPPYSATTLVLIP